MKLARSPILAGSSARCARARAAPRPATHRGADGDHDVAAVDGRGWRCRRLQSVRADSLSACLQRMTPRIAHAVDRGDVVVAVGTGGASPVVARRVRERIEALLPARIAISQASSAVFRKSLHARIPEFSLRRRFWERVIDGPIGALVLEGRKDEAESALKQISNPSRYAGSDETQGGVTLVGRGRAIPTCSR